MKPAVNPVLPEDADKFEAYINKWQAKLNLLDWRIVRSSKRASKAMAEVSKVDTEARLATYRIGLDFGSEQVTDYNLESTAAHELLHIMLAELIEVVTREGHTQEQRYSAEHRVINTLERLLVPRQ